MNKDIENIYKKYKIIFPKKVLHIGANTGQELEYYSALGMEGYHIEAIPEVFKRLSMKCLKAKSQFAIQACVSNVSGEIVNFNISSNNAHSSSMLEFKEHAKIYPDIHFTNTIPLLTTTINELIKLNTIPEDINYLVLDIQGAELLALKGANNLLERSNLSGLYIEVSNCELYSNGSNFTELIDFLRPYGFYLHSVRFNQNGWGNAFFLRGWWPSYQERNEENVEINPDLKIFEKFQITKSFDKNIIYSGKSDYFSIKNTLIRLIPCVDIRHNLIRLGGKRDGSYLLPNDLLGIESCFSPGTSNRKKFEDDLALNYGIKSHMCDGRVEESDLSTPLIEGMQFFSKKWLSAKESDDSITLKKWVQLNSTTNSDHILQMDIEGAEYQNILATDDSILCKFRILIVEFHGLANLRLNSFLYGIFMPTLDKLLRNHSIVHTHANNCGGISVFSEDLKCPNFLEITLCRNDRLLNNTISHSLDIKNVNSKPLIDLDLIWNNLKK
jgi:FkbM family methyltransferase